MSTLPAELFYAEIEASTAVLAALVDSADQDLPIPTCPDWTLRQLATHVGRAQRWAAEIVATRSAEMIQFRAVPDGRLPDDPAARGRWLTSGAARLVEVLREAGEDLVWTFNGLGPAGFWARRMANETLVHCADAQLAAGDEVTIPAEIAADAIDEWLTMITAPLTGQPDPRAEALPQGRTLHVHATDSALSQAGEWLVSNTDGHVEVQASHARGDVAITGPAARLLLVLLRRRPATDPAVRVLGDRELLDQWLAHSSF
ncbi:MAG TPA: maleylpyruvate isomerase family mycothiol-dependent enzyme [Streptosporangiaceae bacterium]|nr:maleylpyruvate isomerase family mycothiol-dependent enzyme [Streptosporangiaceae bacterium]